MALVLGGVSLAIAGRIYTKAYVYECNVDTTPQYTCIHVLVFLFKQPVCMIYMIDALVIRKDTYIPLRLVSLR